MRTRRRSSRRLRGLAQSPRHHSRGRLVQQTPSGDVAVVYIEADDLQTAFVGLGSSQDPFDVWFREQVRVVHGINLEDGFPPPEQILDFRVEAEALG